MSTTIAYNHKGGYWKTRYSFFASFMKSVGRRFFSSPSFPIGVTGGGNVEDLVFQHNLDDPNARTRFYGNTGGSGISVSFNHSITVFNNSIPKFTQNCGGI